MGKGAGRKDGGGGSGGRGFLATLLVEFLSVALGVFLGLLANEWRENKAHQERARLALAQVREELKSNREILARYHQNNEAVLAALEKGAGKKGKEGMKAGRLNYIPALHLESSCWETLLSTGALDYLDLRTIRKFSSVYSAQKVYRESSLLLVQAGLNMSAFAAAAWRKVSEQRFQEEFLDYMKMIHKVEKTLLELYDRALK